jgi:hypothetical protein
LQLKGLPIFKVLAGEHRTIPREVKLRAIAIRDTNIPLPSLGRVPNTDTHSSSVDEKYTALIVSGQWNDPAFA